jgi:hypothetical protein
MNGRKLIVGEIREYIKEGKLMKAILRTSADLELLFFSKLVFEKEIKYELIERWTLGRYTDWVAKHGLIEKEHIPIIRRFNKLRNMIVHDRILIKKIKSDPNKKKKVDELILSLCDIIGSIEVSYEHNQKLEDEHTEYAIKLNTKFEEFFK